MLGYEVVIHRVLCAVDVAHQQTKSSPVLPDIIGLGHPGNVIVLCYLRLLVVLLLYYFAPPPSTKGYGCKVAKAPAETQRIAQH